MSGGVLLPIEDLLDRRRMPNRRPVFGIGIEIELPPPSHGQETEGGYAVEKLTELADLDPQQLTAVANPALRAALERHLARSEGPRAFGFQSFIDPGE